MACDVETGIFTPDEFRKLLHAAPPHLLPILVIGGFAGLTMLTKNSFMEEINKQYVLTARAKGLTERRVIYRHAFKAALVSVIPVLGVQAGFVIGGAVYIETVFQWPGIGDMLVKAMLADPSMRVNFAGLRTIARRRTPALLEELPAVVRAHPNEHVRSRALVLLDEMDDPGFALLTGDPRVCPTRQMVGAWRKHLLWNEVDRFCHRTSPWDLLEGEDALVSCTPLGCLMLLRDQVGDMTGLEAVVVGRSNLFGKPMAGPVSVSISSTVMSRVMTSSSGTKSRNPEVGLGVTPSSRNAKRGWAGSVTGSARRSRSAGWPIWLARFSRSMPCTRMATYAWRAL